MTEILISNKPDSRSDISGNHMPRKKAVITWVGVNDAVEAEVHLYDRLFAEAQPNASGKNFIESLNPNSLKVVTDLAPVVHSC